MDKPIDLLLDKNNNVACQAMKDFQERSENSDRLYIYMEDFFEMTKNKNSYIRTRGLVLIAANAKWDKCGKIDKFIDEYLKHITDEKPITSRQCIKALPEIAKFKPVLRRHITEALKKADISFYADSMRPLIEKDIAQAVECIAKMSNEK